MLRDGKAHIVACCYHNLWDTGQSETCIRYDDPNTNNEKSVLLLYYMQRVTGYHV